MGVNLSLQPPLVQALTYSTRSQLVKHIAPPSCHVNRRMVVYMRFYDRPDAIPKALSINSRHHACLAIAIPT